ncbi:hypothetical protein GCM10011348_04370 [Marinobacterium nitratireducens]|uniref:Uncharacterized protein n=1 Tax=Marinobacterium nitratireducens TaxID=518897 RepID=A0A918DPM8_9GAMM|nr:response regulator [Marinobacterium nitratireducens]GGO76652.1 hypothetical protein GCM10011348_04370 [Marinobacterium nitratireducens]
MDIILDNDASYEQVVEALKRCGAEEAVCCRTEALFGLAKSALVREKIAGVTIQLLDADGYAIRQVTSRRRDENASQGDALNDRQVAVVKALEKVLAYCRKEGVQLVGYSDELVALPAHVKPEDIATASARDIDTRGVYRGAEALMFDPGSDLCKVLG